MKKENNLEKRKRTNKNKIIHNSMLYRKHEDFQCNNCARELSFKKITHKKQILLFLKNNTNLLEREIYNDKKAISNLEKTDELRKNRPKKK